MHLFFVPTFVVPIRAIHLFILIFKDMKETTMMTTMSGTMEAEQRMTSLDIATKFNDEARARLVKRWYQLECEQLGVKMEEQKLLVTEREIMLKSDEIRRGLIAGENADADGCYTVSQLAEMMQITVKELNKRLVAEGVQFRNGGRYMLTKEYEGRGYAQDRSFHYYGLDGEKKEKKYLVWTPAGREFVSAMIYQY